MMRQQYGLQGISIHASRGGSDEADHGYSYFSDISIHASRGGSDQLPHPAFLAGKISIHASRGGSDTWNSVPRNSSTLFQSTLPAGEAT